MSNKFKKRFNFAKYSSFIAGGIGVSSLAFFISPSQITNDINISNVQNKEQSLSLNQNSLANGFVPISNNPSSAPVSTSSGFLGTQDNSRTLVLTSYEGVIVWKHDLLENQPLKASLAEGSYTLQSTGYSVLNWFALHEENLLLVLTGTTNKTHVRLFAIDVDTGALFAPSKNNLGEPVVDLAIAKLNDKLELIVQNSAKEIIVTPFSDYSLYSTQSQLIKVDKNLGISAFKANFYPIDFSSYYNLSGTNGQPAGQTYYFAGLIPLTTGSNKNIMVLIEKNKRLFTNKYGIYPSYGYGIRLVYVKDDFSPYYFMDANIQKVSSIETHPYILGGTFFNSLQKVVKYGYNYGKDTSNAEQFLWNTSGIWNSIDVYKINSSTNKIEVVKTEDLQKPTQDLDVISFVYNQQSKRLYTSNSYSNFGDNNTSNGASLGYFDLNNLTSSSIKYNTIIKRNNGNIPSNAWVYISPVVGETSTPTESPIVVYELNNTTNPIKGYYSSNNSNSLTTVNLTFKTYQNIVEEAKKINLMQNYLPSAVQDNQLINLLKFFVTPNSSNIFSSQIVSKKANDSLRTLDVRYKVSYDSWWNKTVKSHFLIDTHFSGFYDLSNYNFAFVNNYIGNPEIDNKYIKQLELKGKTIASGITKDQILNYFINYKIIDKSGNNVIIDDKMISLSANDNEKELTVTIDLTSKLPNGITNSKPSFTFKGFASFDGYTHSVLTEEEQSKDEKILSLKNNYFPSSIDESDILQNFVKLGNAYSKNINDWTITLSPNDMKGTVSINMIYTNSNVPNGFPEKDKNIMQGHVIKGFRSLVSSFESGPTLSESTRTDKDPSILDMFKEYKKLEGTEEVVTTKLYNALNFPQISNLNMLEVNMKNKNSIIEDGFLDLTINLKEGATTSFLVGNSSFVFTQEKLNEFSSEMNGKYPFNVRWNVKIVKEEFSWAQPVGETIAPDALSSDFLKIDLNYSYFPTVNKEMYADQVTKEDIVSLYSTSNYVVTDTKILPDNESGRLSVSLILNSLSSTEVIAKTLEITGFKIPISPIAIAIPTATIALMLSFVLVVLIYLKVRNANLNKLVNNNMDQNYLDKLSNKNFKKAEKIQKRNTKLFDKKMKKLEKSK